MLDDLGAAIGAHLGAALPAGTTIRLDAPSATWKNDGSISLLLHRVQENRSDAHAGLWTEERDEGGRVVSRTSPERQYDFCYLVTAWAADIEHELALLGSILRAVVSNPLVPATGSLAQVRGPVTLAIGRLGLPAAGPEIWTALSLSPRTSLDLVATAPVPPVVQTDLVRAPEAIDLGLDRSADASAVAAPSRRRRPARITEGDSDG